MTKTDFNNKITSFSKRIFTNKPNHLKFQKKLDSLITEEYIFVFGRIYFASNDGSQNMFIHQPTFNVLKLQIDKGTKYFIG